MVLGLRQFMARAGNGGREPVLDSDNGEEQVVWLSDVDSAKWLCHWFHVSVAATVSGDPEACPSPCIYTQIETEADEDESGDSDSEFNEVLGLSKFTEMRLIPSDASGYSVSDILLVC
ncbi:PREDICTED: chloride conductance regulatory protein ICln [Theobroma cacao]|uniref:Chloride conductance regulatory protein ICln n=1 Tax=Theobroma cacao TaxID=3641 RepID=A0AB32W3B5_THECC|nr:PREDICTED: chloride conductance regulatory protein ICln [Theobroma cacao]